MTSAMLVRDVLASVFPAYETDRPTWAPDAFAVAASLIKRSGAYTRIVNQESAAGLSAEEWQAFVRDRSAEWRDLWDADRDTWPEELERWWREVMRLKNEPVSKITAFPTLVDALASIIAAADEFSAGFGLSQMSSEDLDTPRARLEVFADGRLLLDGTLCLFVDKSRAVVLPKLHNPLGGMTLRSLTHHLAYWDKPEVEVGWIGLQGPIATSGLNLLLLPWPTKIVPSAFSSWTNDRLPANQGYFSYATKAEDRIAERVKGLIGEAERLVGDIHAIVFPELSLTNEDFEAVRKVAGLRLVVAGIGETSARGLGENHVKIARGSHATTPHAQAKHHRWRLDLGQIRQYGLGGTLRAYECLWEAINLQPRKCTFFTTGDGLTFSVLICEDLARQDPVAELVRAVGPNLVIALLLDGPQIAKRWSGRYATVLAEDPRSSVLTLTSAGMVDLAASQSHRGPRSIALWRDADAPEASTIELEADAEGVVACLSRQYFKEWTADGRHDDGQTMYLSLAGVHQVRRPVGDNESLSPDVISPEVQPNIVEKE